jgi:cell division protease FtsH
MSRQENNKGKQPSRFKRPSTDGGDESSRKGPRFNIYWIYGLVLVFLIGYQILQGVTPDATVITDLKFKQDMLSKNHVERVEPVANKDVVRVYIKKDSLELAQYKDMLKEKWSFVKNSKGPHFQFRVSKVEDYQQSLDDYFE